MLRWVITAPLGLLVVPLVYRIIAGLSSPIFGSGLEEIGILPVQMNLTLRSR
jgi:hypothetical protein